MDCCNLRITVLFEDPFWICLVERQNGADYEVCKVTFGAEPKDYEVYEYLLNSYYRLNFGKVAALGGIPEKKYNPKRMQRQIRKSLEPKGIGTKAQQALKLQYEQSKENSRFKRREEREKEKKQRFEKKQLQKIQKHRGH